MATLSVRNIDDDVYQRLKARAAEHGVSVEEEAHRILRQAVLVPERLGELAVRLFGPDHGVDVEPQPRPPHVPRRLGFLDRGLAVPEELDRLGEGEIESLFGDG
jgi:antitoxin FitA